MRVNTFFFFFSSRRRHTRLQGDWSSDVCSSDLPWPPRAHIAQLTLTRLPRPQVGRMVTAVAAGKTLPTEVVQQLVTRSDGVPLFVEELTKLVLESDLLREHEEHYVLTGPLPSLAIPATLQDALMARLDQLASAKAMAQ